MANEVATVPNESVELAILGEGELQIVQEDVEQMGKDIAYRILGSETLDEVFEQGSTLSARDLLGVPLTIQNVRWLQSRMEGTGPKVFALIEAEDLKDGGTKLISCGGRNVMAQLFKAAQMGALPMKEPLMFQENETASGFGALWLVKA